MEEDIKILEEWLIQLNELFEKTKINNTKERKSLKNLIKGYRELEKEIEILREYIIIAPNLDEMTALKYAHIQESAYFRGRAEEQQRANETIHKHFIPKSKIKEKIEELNKEEKGLRNSISAEEYAEYSDSNISFDLMHIEIQRSVLQELMEDK